MEHTIELAKANGYKVYKVKSHDYVRLVTPRRNVLCISKSYWGNGLVFTLMYKPSKDNGSGCTCHKTSEGFYFGIPDHQMTLEKLEELEDYGCKYANELGASLYKDPQEFFDSESRFWKFEEV